MRKKSFITAAVLAVCCMSCTFTVHTVNNNPVGSKVGKRTAWAGPNADLGYKVAAGDGMITKIGTAESRISYFGSFVKITNIVTGE